METPSISFFDIFSSRDDILRLDGEHIDRLRVLWLKFLKESPYAKLTPHKFPLKEDTAFETLDPKYLPILPVFPSDTETKMLFVMYALENNLIESPNKTNCNATEAKSYVAFYKFFLAKNLINLANKHFQKEYDYSRTAWLPSKIKDETNELAKIFSSVVKARNALGVQWQEEGLLNFGASVPKVVRKHGVEEETNYSYSIPYELYLSEILEKTALSNAKEKSLIENLEDIPRFRNVLLGTAVRAYTSKNKGNTNDLLVKILEEDSYINTVTAFQDEDVSYSYLKAWESRLGINGIKEIVDRPKSSQNLLKSVVKFCLTEANKSENVTPEYCVQWALGLHKSIGKSIDYNDKDRFPDTHIKSLRAWINVIEDIVKDDLGLRNALYEKEMEHFDRFAYVLYDAYGVDQNTYTPENIKTRFMEPINEAIDKSIETVNFASYKLHQSQETLFHGVNGEITPDTLEQQAINSSFLLKKPKRHQNLRKKDPFLKLFKLLDDKKVLALLSDSQKLKLRSLLFSRTVAGKTDEGILGKIKKGRYSLTANQEDMNEAVKVTVNAFLKNYPKSLKYDTSNPNASYEVVLNQGSADIPEIMLKPFFIELFRVSQKENKLVNSSWVEGFDLPVFKTLDGIANGEWKNTFTDEKTLFELKQEVVKTFSPEVLVKDWIKNYLFHSPTSSSQSQEDYSKYSLSVIREVIQNVAIRSNDEDYQKFLDFLNKQREIHLENKGKGRYHLEDRYFKDWLSILNIGRLEQQIMPSHLKEDGEAKTKKRRGLSP